MDFLTSQEIRISLLVEAGILLLIAVGVICYLVYRLLRLSKQTVTTTGTGHGPSVSEYLRTEIKKTQEKQSHLGKNSNETIQLNAACDLRKQVLAGEVEVLSSAGDDENHYWQPVLDYYNIIFAKSATKFKALEEHLKVGQKRIENLEKFKEKVFQLRDTLDQAYENNSRLEKELREKIKQGAKLSALEHTLCQMEAEKEHLAKELQLAENEFVILMENVGAGKIGAECENQPDIAEVGSLEEELKKKLASVEEENEFLCDQIQTLLNMEVELEEKEKNKDEKILELEKRYTKMEERYLKLQDKLDEYQQTASR